MTREAPQVSNVLTCFSLVEILRGMKPGNKTTNDKQLDVRIVICTVLTLIFKLASNETGTGDAWATTTRILERILNTIQVARFFFTSFHKFLLIYCI